LEHKNTSAKTIAKSGESQYRGNPEEKEGIEHLVKFPNAAQQKMAKNQKRKGGPTKDRQRKGEE